MAKRQRKRKRTEDEERAFWSKHDSVGLVDWSTARRLTLPILKPSVKTISIRLPESMLEELKVLANKSDVPYQTLIKIILTDRLEKEAKDAA